MYAGLQMYTCMQHEKNNFRFSGHLIYLDHSTTAEGKQYKICGRFPLYTVNKSLPRRKDMKLLHRIHRFQAVHKPCRIHTIHIIQIKMHRDQQLCLRMLCQKLYGYIPFSVIRLYSITAQRTPPHSFPDYSPQSPACRRNKWFDKRRLPAFHGYP